MRSTGGSWVWPAAFVLLLVLTTATGMAVAYNSHLMRAELARHKDLQAYTDELLTEYSRLLLERGAYSSYQNVDRLAAESLDMRFPEITNRVVVP